MIYATGAAISSALCVPLVLSVVLLPAPVRAETPPEYFEPASSWVMDYAEDSCALRRAFVDEAGRTVFLDMRQYAPRSFLTFTVFSSDVARMPEEVRYRFEPDDDVSDVGFAFAVDFGDDVRGVRFTGDYLRVDDRPDEPEDFFAIDPAVFVARENEITEFTILEGFEDTIVLQTGLLASPMAAMRTCLDELLTHWGIDAEAQKSLTRRVEPRNWNGIGQNLLADFPAAMIRDRQSATMQVRLIVGADGRVDDCKFIGIVGEVDYGEAACESLSRHARFNPALDANGEPVTSFWTTDLSFWTR